MGSFTLQPFYFQKERPSKYMKEDLGWEGRVSLDVVKRKNLVLKKAPCYADIWGSESSFMHS
jgi:hypothetical protein